MVEWQPGATQAIRLARDQLYRQIRAFFHARDFIEVDPPLLGRAGSTDVHLHSVHTHVDEQDYYLQTSPEFFMKRLLADECGPIFALTKSFRRGEAGRYHNLEFTLLEWYQPGYDDHDLMSQVAELLNIVLEENAQKFSYRDSFYHSTGLNPHTAEIKELQAYAEDKLAIDWHSDDRDTLLDLIFSHCVQPTLQQATFVYDYPATQAALARLDTNAEGETIARRFEVFCRGVELGNGYWELTDGGEQARRFAIDNQRRQKAGLPVIAIDEKLLAAMNAGLPECAGIAIGVDRLLMLITKAAHINEVIDFPSHYL